MSNLSDLLPSGGGSKSAEFVASGTLPNGQAVILNANGTVTAVSQTSTPVSESIPAGSAVVFEQGANIPGSVAFDTNTVGKFVIVYQDTDNSQYGTAIVGSVSGTSITFGSAVVFNSAETTDFSIAFDPNTAGKFVVAYKNHSASNSPAVVGTVSGTSISFGTSVAFEASTSSSFCSVSFDPNTANNFVIAYKTASPNVSRAISGTVSGTSLSFGTPVTFVNATEYISAAFDPSTAGKFVVAYRDDGNSLSGTAIVGTVSGTSITFGSAVVFNSGSQTDYISLSFDPNTANKFVITYTNGGGSSYGTGIIGTVSGTSVSYGSAYVFNSANTQPISASFDPSTAGKFVAAYRDFTSSLYYGTAVVGTVSGTSISFGSKSVFNTANTNYIQMAFDPSRAGMFVVVYTNAGNSNRGTAILGQIAATSIVTNLTSTNFVGMPDKAYAASATATVVAKGGVSLNQTSLTIGTTYYVQGDGTLGTSAGTPSVEAGRAISATSILLKGK